MSNIFKERFDTKRDSDQYEDLLVITECGIEELYQALKKRMIKEISADPDQIMRDNLSAHNDKVKSEQLTSAYRAGYYGDAIFYPTENEQIEYDLGAKDRQREKGDE